MEYKEFFPWLFFGIVTTLMFFAQRWIARIDSDRESLQKDVRGLESKAMKSGDAEQWIRRLDRDRDKLESRISELEKNYIHKSEVYMMRDELKKDLNFRLSEIRQDFYHKYDYLVNRQTILYDKIQKEDDD